MLREQLAGRVRHRCDRRMSYLALDRYRVELRLHATDHPDPHEAILASKLCFENRRHGSIAVSGARELAQHRVILELTEHQWTDPLSLEPLIQGTSNGSVIRWQKDRDAIQRFRKASPQGFRERRRCHPVHIAAAQRVAVCPNIQARSDGRIRQYDIDFVDGEVGDQTFERSFAAGEPHRLLQLQAGLHDQLRDFLRYDIVDHYQ